MGKKLFDYVIHYILPIVCKNLIAEDREAFLEIAHSDAVGRLVISDEENDYSTQKTYEHLIENVYIRTAQSSYDTLTTMAKLVRAFDEKTGSEYADNIMFSIR